MIDEHDDDLEPPEDEENMCGHCGGEMKLQGRAIDEHNTEEWYQCTACGTTRND